jgi:hypothetical protein
MMVLKGDPPTGGVSPLSWAIIGALAAVCATVIPALWARGNKLQDQMYADLKTCNESKEQLQEDTLGLLKVLRLQMEQSKEGKKR